MNVLRRILAELAAMPGRRDGVAALEFAMTAPLLIVLLVSVVDLGGGLYQQAEVKSAAQAGAGYALLHAPNFDSQGISTAVTNSTNLPSISLSPAPAQSCGCPTGSAVTGASCGTTCANGQSAGTYVTVNAQAQYTPLLSYAVLGASVTLTAQSTVRIK